MIETTPMHWDRIYDREPNRSIFSSVQEILDPILRRVMKISEVYCSNIVFLEAGCGDGRVIQALSQRIKDGFYVGVDFSLKALMKVKTRGILGIGHVDLIYADIRCLPIREHAFNVITCLGVIEHFTIPTSIEIVHGLLHSLAPGGTLYIETPNRTAFGLTRKRADATAYQYGHHDYYTSDELCALAMHAVKQNEESSCYRVKGSTFSFSTAVFRTLRESNLPNLFRRFSVWIVFGPALLLNPFLGTKGFFSETVITKSKTIMCSYRY